jgi:hypothetical protein
VLVVRAASDGKISAARRSGTTRFGIDLECANPKSAYRVLVDARDWRSGFISRADVADFLVKQVNDASLVHKTLALIG